MLHNGSPYLPNSAILRKENFNILVLLIYTLLEDNSVSIEEIGQVLLDYFPVGQVYRDAYPGSVERAHRYQRIFQEAVTYRQKGNSQKIFAILNEYYPSHHPLYSYNDMHHNMHYILYTYLFESYGNTLDSSPAKGKPRNSFTEEQVSEFFNIRHSKDEYFSRGDTKTISDLFSAYSGILANPNYQIITIQEILKARYTVHGVSRGNLVQKVLDLKILLPKTRAAIAILEMGKTGL
jgi:hypothetical protein